MKIAVSGTRGFPGIQGGVENHCEKLYPYLVKMGCDIVLFTRKPYLLSTAGEYNGVKLIPVDCPRNKFLEAIVHTFKSVLKARSIKPDIMHLHAVGPSLLAPVARLLGMKVVVTHHGPDYMRKKWPLPAKLFLKFCEKMGVVYANQLITIARNISEDIDNKYGKVSVIIPNGVEIQKPADTEEVLKKFNLRRQEYILSVGRFVPEKGFDDLMEAFSQARLDQKKLVIVGEADHDDRYSCALRSYASKNEHIVLTGFLNGQPLHELYSHAGLFVLPSYYEGLPIVLLEAMSYGLSCIASDIPANRNIEMDKERFFSAGDINQLKNKMTKFVNQPWTEDCRRGQIEMISQNYDWKKIAECTMSVYSKLICAEH